MFFGVFLPLGFPNRYKDMTMMRRPDDKCVTSRSRLQDSIKIDGDYITIHKLFRTNPLFLWNLIHTKGTKVRLVSTDYFKLKQLILEIDPELIAINDVKRELHKNKRKLSKAIATGTIGTDKSSYKRLG